MAGPVTITDVFAEQCSPVINTDYDTCGTVTRATVAHLTATQLETLFTPGGLFADLDAWFFHSIEMKACGVRRYAFYDWIMANTDRTMARAQLSVTKVQKSPSLLHPFILARQYSVVNRDYWKVTDGFAEGDYTPATTGPLTQADLDLMTEGTDRIIRVESRHSIPADANWFRVRDNVHIIGSDGGLAQHGQWRVLAAVAADDLTSVDVVVRSVNAGSTEPYAAAPTAGVIINGVNNVSDYEQWCQNLPTIDPRKRVLFWWQTWRGARCIDSEYKEVYKRLYDTNPAFREFGDQPLAERNRQDELESQRRFVHAFFYNKPISASQTKDLWESLEAINTPVGAVLDPGTSGKLIARRANFIGVREQLRQCDRVFDLQGNPLNFYEWLDLNYNIKRARQTILQRKVGDIDWYTSERFRAQMQTAFMQYYKQEYLEQLRITVEYGKINQLGQVYDTYYAKYPNGVRINVLSDEFFDDFQDEFEHQSIGDRGNLLVCLDIGKPGPSGGTIYYGQIAVNRKVYTSAKIEELAKFDSTYRCVLETIQQEQTLMSETGTVIVECPLASAWIENFSSDVPDTTGKSEPYTNIY